MLKFRTHGKWILAGEHAVIRGGTALVFPVSSRHLDFEFQQGPQMKLVMPAQNSDLEMAFWGVFEKSLQALGLERSDVSGEIRLSSNIPVGAGMGASATLCVSLARWFSELGYLKAEEMFDFAKGLENIFHGQSSGVDVAVALNNSPLKYKAPGEMKAFKPSWEPGFYLSYCGKRGVTSDCIDKVNRLLRANPPEGERIDQQMQQAVNMAEEALLTEGHWPLLADSMNLASQCFEEWGLLSRDLESHMDLLKDKGALAAKPTGSGDGGFVLSLWKQPPSIPGIELIQA